MIEIEKINNDVGLAIEESLKELNASLSQVDIKVVEFGLFKKTKIVVKLNEVEQQIRQKLRDKEQAKLKALQDELDAKAESIARKNLQSSNILDTKPAPITSAATNEIEIANTSTAINEIEIAKTSPATRLVEDNFQNNNKPNQFEKKDFSNKNNNQFNKDKNQLNKQNNNNKQPNQPNNNKSLNRDNYNKSPNNIENKNKPLNRDNNLDKNNKSINSENRNFDKNNKSLNKDNNNKNLDNSNNNKNENQKKDFSKPIQNFAKHYEPSLEQQEKIFKAFLPNLEKMTIVVEHPLKTHLTTLLKLMDIKECEITLHNIGHEWYMSMPSNDLSVVARRGEVLDSLEILLNAFLNNLPENKHDRLTLDCNNFRQDRLKSLMQYVIKTSDKVVSLGRKIKLEPMSDINRKFVHTVLESDERVFAKSEGSGNNRSIVIFVKNK